MNGNLFQIHSEHKNKYQLMETIEAIKIYCSTEYKNDIKSLTILFMELKTPGVKNQRNRKRLSP